MSNSVFSWLANNWAIILLVVAAVVAVVVLLKHNQTAILKKVLYAIVSEAERQFGGGTGSLKLAEAVQKVYELIPSWLKALFTADDIINMIEEVLKEAKEQWANDPDIGDYVNPPEPEIPDTTEPETPAPEPTEPEVPAEPETPAEPTPEAPAEGEAK